MTDFLAILLTRALIRLLGMGSGAGESGRVGGTMVAESKSAKPKCSLSVSEKPVSRFSRTAPMDGSPSEYANAYGMERNEDHTAAFFQ